MFNTTFLISLLFLSIYIFNLTVLTIFIAKYNNQVFFKTSSRIVWTNLNKIIFTCLIIILAGLPPVSFFFFKIFVVLNSQNTWLVVFMMCLVNVFILYYYLNFLTSFLNETSVRNQLNIVKTLSIFNNKYILVSGYYTTLLVCFFLNFYFIFFWEFFLCFFFVI